MSDAPTRLDYELVRYFATWGSNRELVSDAKQDALHRLADKLARAVPETEMTRPLTDAEKQLLGSTR